jgi:PAS domain S-box-containing protein
VRALRFALAAAAALVEAAIATALVFASNHDSSPWLIAPFALSAGLSFVAAGLVALWRRPDNATGFWLAATGYLWFIAALTESNDTWVWTIGAGINNLAFVAFVALILAYPHGELSRRDRWLVAIGGTAAIGVNVVAGLVDKTPADSCDECPPSAIAVADLPWVKTTVGLIGTVIVALVLIAVVAILAQRWRRATSAQRRLLRPVYGSCSLSLLLLLISMFVEQINEVAWSVIWVFFLLSFVAVPLTFLAGVLRSRFDRAAVARMLLALDAGAPLRETLAETLHDPSLEIVYWLDAQSQWVDAEGHRVAEPTPTLSAPRRSVTTVERHGDRIAALVHDPALDLEPEIVNSIAAGAALALQTERLQAELRAQYELLVTVVDTAPSLLVVLSTQGRIQNQNRAVLEASGYADEELIRGRYFWDVFIDPEERSAMIERFEQAAPDFAPAEYENTFTNIRGERRVIAWRSAPTKDESGRVTGIVAGGIDITERKQQEEEIRASRSRIVQTADETRRKLERNLHDGAQQRLVALSVALRLAETKLDSDTAAAAAILAGARDELSHALEELRELARGIHPAVLTDRGLSAAIDALVARTPLPVTVELADGDLPPAVEAALYYVVAEALTNVVKYADATSASVRLEVNGNGTVVAEVSDDGIGGADPTRGSGLRGLVDRVEALDGRLTVESPETGGTLVRVELPTLAVLPG